MAYISSEPKTCRQPASTSSLHVGLVNLSEHLEHFETSKLELLSSSGIILLPLRHYSPMHLLVGDSDSELISHKVLSAQFIDL